MLRAKKADIYIHFTKSKYYLGEFITGNIEINSYITAKIRDIIITIDYLEEWNLKDGDKIKNEKITKKITTVKLDLQKSQMLRKIDGNLILPFGISLFPFCFRFSEDHPPCFEFPHPEKSAYIRYNFVVSIDSPDITGTKSELLCLLSRPILDFENKHTASVTKSVKSWKLFSKGDATLTVNCPENNYTYDSICKLDINIDNTNGKMTTKEYKVDLKRTIIFKTKNGEIKLLIIYLLKKKTLKKNINMQTHNYLII